MNDFIEYLIKANLLLDSRTREITENLSRLKSATDAYSILQYRAYCCNLLQLLNSNIFTFLSIDEKHKLLIICQNEISQCDAAMLHLQGKVILDALLSQLFQPIK